MVGTGSTDPIGYAINGMFADDTENSTAGRTSSQGDIVQTWDATTQGYTTWFFSSNAGNAWASSSTPRVATTDAFETGDGYWYLNRSDEAYTLTVSGEVSEKQVEVSLAPGYTLVCNPFPADLALNSDDIDWGTAGATSGRTSSQGDIIQIWDIQTQGYTTWFFSSNAGNAWASSSTPRVATTDVIPAGQGFWYLNRGTQTITITLKSPLAD